VAIFFPVIDENVAGLRVQALLFGRTATDLDLEAAVKIGDTAA